MFGVEEREGGFQRCWFAAAICADCGFCSDSAATTIVHQPPTASSSTVDHLSLVPATRHTPSRPLSVATTVFLSGYHQPYFSQTTWLYFSHFFIFSPVPPLELIGGQGIVSESSFGKVAERKTKFIGIVSNFHDNSKYGFYEAGHLQKLDWRTPTMGWHFNCHDSKKVQNCPIKDTKVHINQRWI